ncbi:alpha-keto acid decarboxylase family protein [Cetobacterium somerae]|uniref:alpha-keto acid decarboxylase family protein n=1 Tax=Cetobacterium somerae TaxID=188913 RepID=UPI0022522741|nr:alpha-keto acid decarboxylase family protein [Cetobacterium somerae]MCX3068217.1 alpha-keto acid decarboxylase family protein [Cetobacterium somerae]
MKIKVADYLLESLKKYGIKHVFGVPGDYNLSFLDYIEDMEGIDWVGNCNELNASYAADGYARINGMSAIVTTFGAGELSAINGVAGSYAEKVPVVKIVGRPSFNIVENKEIVHHTLGDGDFEVFHKIYSNVTGAQCVLTLRNAQMEIDRVLNVCFTEKIPVYIELSSDIAGQEIEVVSETPVYKFETDQKTLGSFVAKLSSLLSTSKGQAILADYEVSRHKLEKELSTFIESAKIPCTTLSMGKGVIDETSKYFMGTYNGVLSNDTIKKVAENTDLLLMIGAVFTDSTTAGFKMINPKIDLIEIHPYYCKIDGVCYNNLLMKDVLAELGKLSFFNNSTVEHQPIPEFAPAGRLLTQKRMLEAIQGFLKEDDILVAEQGTSFFGASELSLPKNSVLVGQPLWGSIGYTLGALLGTQFADVNRRNILLIGDGSFQLTAQEVTTMLRHKLKPIIMVINNDGYTVEKLIHGAHRQYNNINMWRYKDIPQTLNLDPEVYTSYSIKSETEFYDALNASKNTDKLVFMELHLNADDAPDLLIKLGQLFKEEDAY